MNVEESSGKELSLKNNVFTVNTDSEAFNLKTIKIQKKPLCYAFIGGMWYSKNGFSLEQDISLPYPFSTYYTTKILDKIYNDILCRSLYYVKMPVVVLQFQDECICIEFDPVIQSNGREMIPFISLSEDKENYIISFYLFNEFYLKEKEYAWLGRGKKKKVPLGLKPGDSFKFFVKTRKYKEWTEAVETYVEKELPKQVKIESAKATFEQGKQALFRSYDHLTGSFLQLPWRETPGFTFVNSSYSLLSYEAVRLHYFAKWHKQTGDKQFLLWSKGLQDLFKNPKLYKTRLKEGRGIVWYNMTNLTKNGLEGFFYMDCGYGGYPGGQGTISFHLLKYLEFCDDKKLEDLVEKSLEYILSTQNNNGSWPMAIRQEGVIRFRSEQLDLYETYGGTAECVRALLLGYKRFNDNSMKNAAIKALSFLENEYPICYNGLRDIGINEAEAFSAVSIIDAFLDAYKLTEEKRYCDNAVVYALYTLPWLYFYDTENLKLKYDFHPISFSITPRLSPYESVWVVSTYLRLYSVTKNELWKKAAEAVYKEAVKWVSKNGGLCEGVFPKFLKGLYCLPMEQTFATVELLNASSHFFTSETKKIDGKIKDSDNKIRLEKKQDVLVVFYEDEEILRFDMAKCKIIFLKGGMLNEYGISFSFPDVYSLGNRIKRFIKKQIRGGPGKFILSVFDVKYFLKGVHEPEINKEIKIHHFGKYVKKWDVSVDKNSAVGFCETDLHRIEYTMSVTKKGNDFVISFDPLIIKVLNHDLSIGHTFFPVIGSKSKKRVGRQLFFDGFAVSGDFRDIVFGDDFTAVDQTRATNWTHGGLYKGRFDIVLQMNK